METDGGLAERERQDAEREADHQARREHVAGGAVSDEEKVGQKSESESKPKSKPKSRARAKKT